MSISRFMGLLVLVTAVSCRYPNEFKNASDSALHAILRGKSYTDPGHVFATHINGRPTSFWRWNDDFRIPAGTNVVHTAYSGRQGTFGYKSAHFVAVAGHDYLLARKQEMSMVSLLSATPHPTTRRAWIIHDKRDQVVITQKNTNAPDLLIAEVPREDYVFGAASAKEAIAQYLRKRR